MSVFRGLGYAKYVNHEMRSEKKKKETKSKKERKKEKSCSNESETGWINQSPDIIL